MNGNLAYQEERATELIGGHIVMMAPALINHTVIAGNIYRIFGNYLNGKKCIPLTDGALAYLTENDHFVPDFMIVCDKSKIKYDGVHGAPDLVVEILSHSTAKNDRTHKKEVYAQCGVREYWIVSPLDKSIEQYLLQDGQLILNEVYTLPRAWMKNLLTEEEDKELATHFKCSLYDDLELSLSDIFSGLLPEPESL